MRLEQSLVLNRFLNALFGADGLEELKQPLNVQEGPGADGQSYFYGALLGRVRDPLIQTKLAEYDARVMGYEARLAAARGAFAFKYFQYLALLYTEICLDWLTCDPPGFLSALNAFLQSVKSRELSLRDFPSFQPADLRRLAFFMATGSGKTLLLHVNLWQVLHYLAHSGHPEALVSRADGRREFESLLLITPNEGLSQQHLEEFRASGVEASLLVAGDTSRPRLFGPELRVVEIHKLAEEASRDGVSLPLEELGGANLVFVDEGHKGTGSEAQTWKRRQKRLSENGFLIEYSATFAQSIGAASRRAQQGLMAEYGKAILFDYSYRHFYSDGYGKDFEVLNVARARGDQAHDLLIGGLLTYYQQLRLYSDRKAAYHGYNIDKPLWIFLGSSVNSVYLRAGHNQSDVATVVDFIRRLLSEPDWAISAIARTLRGQSGFVDARHGVELFAPKLTHLLNLPPSQLYREITEHVFHGRGKLEVWELKEAEGELGLRVSASGDRENPFFGVINIGDVPSFKKHLLENVMVEVREQRFVQSLFREINVPGSSVNVLVGAKKFIEGWSSWRVSSMGLLNMGKGEGPQVIQLFGRGVRLKGKDWSLKRSAAGPDAVIHPPGLDKLETLSIFGWNADYLSAFQEVIGREDIGQEVNVQLRLLDPMPDLLIPERELGYEVKEETWSLTGEDLHVVVDARPHITLGAGIALPTRGRLGDPDALDFGSPNINGLLDLNALHRDLVLYKERRGYGNVFIPRDKLLPILRNCTLYMPRIDWQKPSEIHNGALRVLATYLDRFVARKEREAESRHLQPTVLAARERVVNYRVLVRSEELLKEIEVLLANPTELYKDDSGRPLPRLHVDRHLFSPLLLDPKKHGVDALSLSPPGLTPEEADFVNDLRRFWQSNHALTAFTNLEIFLLRNLPRVGVGFFHASQFFPDFILWLNDVQTSRTRVRFVEPHGMHHGGLSGNRDKIEALKELERLSKKPAFRAKNLSMSGYLLTRTERDKIPGAETLDWSVLGRDYKLLQQTGDYVQALSSVTASTTYHRRRRTERPGERPKLGSGPGRV